MPTRILRERAAERGVALQQVVEVLQPVARAHFGPRLRMELSTSAERPLVELYAAFQVKPTDEGEAAIAYQTALAHFGHPVDSAARAAAAQQQQRPEQQQRAAAGTAARRPRGALDAQGQRGESRHACGVLHLDHEGEQAF